MIENKTVLHFFILIILISCGKNIETYETNEFISRFRITDNDENVYFGLESLESHIYLSEDAYYSGTPDSIINTSKDYFELNLSNKDESFWLQIFSKDENDNLVKINLNDKYALPAREMNNISGVEYDIIVKTPVFLIYQLRYEFYNINEYRYFDGTYYDWDEGSYPEYRPDIQLLITDKFSSNIHENIWRGDSSTEAVNIVIDDLYKEYEFLLIDKDDNNNYDLVFSQILVFKELLDKRIIEIPFINNVNYYERNYSRSTYYTKELGSNTRGPVLIYYKLIWN